jgi:hypothetical protein
LRRELYVASIQLILGRCQNCFLSCRNKDELLVVIAVKICV